MHNQLPAPNSQLPTPTTHPPSPTIQPPTAYTDAPTLHPNLILGSLHLLFWLFFHPSAWRNHVAQIDSSLSPNLSLVELKRLKLYRDNPALRRLLVQTYVVWPILAGLLVGLLFLCIGIFGQEILFGVLIIAAFIAVFVAVFVVASSVIGGVIFGMVFGVAFGIATAIPLVMAVAIPLSMMSHLPNTMLFSVAGGVTFGVAGNLVAMVGTIMPFWHDTSSLSPRASEIIVSIIVGSVVGSVAYGVVGYIVFIVLGIAVGGIAGSMAFVMGVGMIFGMFSHSWRRGVVFGVMFVVLLGVVGNVALGVAASMSVGMWFSALFALPYLVFEATSGSRAGAVAGAVSGGSFWIWVASSLASSREPEAIFIVFAGVVSLLLGLTLHLWRPILLYPLVAIYNLILYRAEQQRDPRKPALLRYHTAFWDEHQRLPLIGLGKHVVLVAKRNPAEGQQAIDYLSTSRQRWAVQTKLDA